MMNSSRGFSTTLESARKSGVSPLVSPPQPIISDEFYKIFFICILPCIQFFNVAGIITNIINIVVFVKLGRAESTNISFQALAICDLVLSVLSLWTFTSLSLRLYPVSLPFEPYTVTILTGSGLWNFVVRWGALLTAYISLERCLCILKPLEVKRILTPKVTTVAVMVMLVLTVGPAVYLYIKYKFVWEAVPPLNKTILVVIRIKTPEVLLLGAVVNAFAGLMQPIAAFVTVVVCTVYLGIYLGRASAWRRATTSAAAHTVNVPGKGTQDETSTSQKEQRVIRMVISIAVVFIVCVTPSTVHIFTMGIFPQFSFDSQYANIFNTMFILSCLGSSVNASVNIFIYHRMGSRYKTVFRQIFSIVDKDSTSK